MSQVPLYIFDLDGTLALNEHRQHILNDKDDPKRWDKFFEACVDDLPNTPVINTLHTLYCWGADVYIWSGRSEDVRSQTIDWLLEHGSAEWTEATLLELKMRPSGDFTPDEVLKKQWLDTLSPGDRARLVAVFDDRDKVVQMWRDSGVACFQVAKGDF